jgi:hypothetical protein
MVTGAKLLGIALGALLLLTSATAARAGGWDGACQRKIAHEQHELDKAIARHGYWSRQAEHERRELDRLYDRCSYRLDRDDYRHPY